MIRELILLPQAMQYNFFLYLKKNQYFYFLESKTSECIICEEKTNILIKEQQPFIFINNTNINEKNLFNILLLKYKEK